MNIKTSGKLTETAVVVIPEHIAPDMWLHKIGGLPLFLRTLMALNRAGILRVHIIQPHKNTSYRILQELAQDADLSNMSITFNQPHDMLPVQPFWLVAANLVWNHHLWMHLNGEYIKALTQDEKMVIPLIFFDTALKTSLEDMMTRFQAQKKIPPDIVKCQAMESLSPGIDVGIQVNDERDAKEAEKMLFRTDFKHTDGVVSRYLNRPLSRKISRFLIETPVNPNTISWFVFALGLVAIYFTQRGGYFYMLIGAVLFNLNSIADGIDGEIARIRFQDSQFGEWLDRILDKVVMVLYFAAILIGYMRFHQNIVYLVIGSFSVMGIGIGFTLNYWYGYRFKNEIIHRIDNPQGKVQKIADRAMSAMIFGSVDTRKSKPRTRKLDILQMLNVFMKNDVLGILYLVLALAGILHIIFFIILPYALLIFPFGIYALMQLIRTALHRSPN